MRTVSAKPPKDGTSGSRCVIRWLLSAERYYCNYVITATLVVDSPTKSVDYIG